MELLELEKRLNQSFNALRTENQNLIELLKVRQFKIKDSLITPSTYSNENNDSLKWKMEDDPINSLYARALQKSKTSAYPTSGPKFNHMLENTNVLMSHSEAQSERARLSLAQCTKTKFAEHNRERCESLEGKKCFLNPFIKTIHICTM